MNFSTSSINAAVCDATPGFTTFNVSYNKDGTWTVDDMALERLSDGSLGLVEKARHTTRPVEAVNAEVWNEAGSAVISTGHAANFHLPTTVTHLSNPQGIEVLRDYQIGRVGGHHRAGVSCVGLDGTTGTFSQ
jgi:hypothetical protein